MTVRPASSTTTPPSQNAAIAASSAASSATELYTAMGGQDRAPQTRAAWMRGSGGEMARAARGSEAGKWGRGRRSMPTSVPGDGRLPRSTPCS